MPPIERSPGHTRDEDQPGPYLRRLRDIPYEMLQRLSEELGWRPATSLTEARAAAFIDGRLRRSGLHVTADTFTTLPSIGWGGTIAAALALLASLLYYWTPVVSLALMAGSIGVLVAELVRGPLLTKPQPCQNVVGNRASSDERRTRLVLVARLDTPALPKPLATALGGALIAYLRLAAAALLSALMVVGVLDPQRIWLYLQALPVLYLLATAALDQLGRRGAGTTPLHESAGLGVMLACVQGLDVLEHTELWAVGLGASATGAGLADLLRRYPFDQETTVFVALEGLGSHAPTLVAAEGWPRMREADFEMTNALIQEAASRDIQLRVIQTRLYHLAGPLLRAGWRALTFACLGPSPRAAPIDPEDLERATRCVIGLARAIDRWE